MQKSRILWKLRALSLLWSLSIPLSYPLPFKIYPLQKEIVFRYITLWEQIDKVIDSVNMYVIGNCTATVGKLTQIRLNTMKTYKVDCPFFKFPGVCIIQILLNKKPVIWYFSVIYFALITWRYNVTYYCDTSTDIVRWGI